MKFFIIFISLFFTSTVSSVSYKFEVYRSPGLQVWKIEEKKVPATVPYNRFMEFGFKKAFIVIFKRFNLDMNIFYWLGTGISMEKREHTAYCAGLLITQLSEEMPGVRISSISREVDSLESEDFRELFNLTPQYFQRLYRVSGSVGQHIMQVPCSYKKLNSSDSFVLDCKNSIHVWHTIGSKQRKRKIADALARRINRIQKNGKSDIFTLYPYDYQSMEDVEYLKSGFFGNIPDALNSFPINYSTESDNELKQIRHKEVILKEYSMVSDMVIEKLIKTRPPQLSMFKKEKAYILEVLHNRNTFVYLGVNANPKVIQKAMVNAENSFMDKSEYDNFFLEVAWKKVIIIYLNQELPVYFLVNFDEIDKLLLEEETSD